MTKDPIIRLEVALEAINRERASVMAELMQEEKKDKPNKALIEFLKTQTQAFIKLGKSLDFNDTEAVDTIIRRYTPKGEIVNA